MSDVLAEIVAHTRCQVERARHAVPLEHLTSAPGYFLPCRNFFGAAAAPRRGGPNLIVEIRGRGPSAGSGRADVDFVALAGAVEAAGACAVGLTADAEDADHDLNLIRRVKDAVGIPVLRGDLHIDAYQVHESRAAGADAVSVMADALQPDETVGLVELARRLDLTVLLELHDRPRARETLGQVADRVRTGVLAGLSNRNPHTLQLDPAMTEDLASFVPPGLPIVAIGGIRTRADVERMHAAGARAVMIGDALRAAADVPGTIHALFGRPRG